MAESTEFPDLVEGRLRVLGATDDEIARLREEHEQLDYYDRFVRNQQGEGIDDASLNAVLVLSRERWAQQDKTAPAVEENEEDATEEEIASPDDGEAEDSDPQVRTTDVPDATVAKVIEWVNAENTQNRAQAALDKERRSGDPRGSLINQLERIIGG